MEGITKACKSDRNNQKTRDRKKEIKKFFFFFFFFLLLFSLSIEEKLKHVILIVGEVDAIRAPDRGHFCVFDTNKMGKNSYSLKPMRQENAH